MKKTILLLFTVLLLYSCGKVDNKNFSVPAIFSDNMVLQQNTDVTVWGTSSPGMSVKLEGSWREESDAVTDKNGNWSAKIKTLEAGGPFNLTIETGDTSVTFSNILFGEVWLGSGQSNMEMPLMGWPPRDTIMHSAQEIKNADFPNMRLFTVQKAISTEEEYNCKGTWVECTPENIQEFSATAFFFGKKIMNELDVPVGLIHSSWGGTPVESWMSKSKLKTTDDYSDFISKLENSKSAFDSLDNWLNSFPIMDANKITDKWKNLDFDDSHCPEVNYDISKWQTMKLPGLWEYTGIGDMDGAVWFRKTVDIPENWINKNLTLELGPIDDMDVTYVNSKRVGGYEVDGEWQTERVYEVHPDINNSSSLTIAVRVLDPQGGGGLYGTPEQMKLTLKGSNEKISLAGEWKYLPVAEYKNGNFYVFGSDNAPAFTRPSVPIELSAYSPSILYNAMINPIVPYTIKGVIWYQGESNTGRAEQYKRLFPGMIENWRESWDIVFPFYYVQIAPFRYGNETNSQELREAQFVTLSTPKTGMAVTMDIGNPDNIHPSNKKDVGERLAFWALAKDYNKDMVYSGPAYKSMEVEKGKIVLSFDHTDGGLVIKPIKGQNNFMIAGKNKRFVKAKVKVRDDKLIISSPKVRNPVAVRYAWSDIAEGTLFNGAGLPSSSFRTDNWK